jgi:hypothetical protein
VKWKNSVWVPFATLIAENKVIISITKIRDNISILILRELNMIQCSQKCDFRKSLVCSARIGGIFYLSLESFQDSKTIFLANFLLPYLFDFFSFWRRTSSVFSFFTEASVSLHCTA